MKKLLIFLFAYLQFNQSSYAQTNQVIIDDVLNVQLNNTPYISSLNLYGHFEELVIPFGFPDRWHEHPYIFYDSSSNEPYIGAYPNGTLLHDTVLSRGNHLPIEEWFEPAYDDYFNRQSNGLYTVNF